MLNSFGCKVKLLKTEYCTLPTDIGGLAQLARAPALHAGGQRFDSVILHKAPPGLPKGEERGILVSPLGARGLKFIDILR